MNRIRIEYFAILREHTGLESEELDTEAATVSDLYDELNIRHRFPDVGTVKVAVNDEFSDWSAALNNGDSVVFIPPVAGG